MARNGKVQDARCEVASGSKNEWEERAVGSDGKIVASVERNVEDVPEPPEIGNDGHREHDDALDGHGNVEDVTGDAETGDDDEEKRRRNCDSCEIRAKIGVLVHLQPPRGGRAEPGWHPGKRS